MSDDWTGKDLEKEIRDELCPNCGTMHVIQILLGPQHGGWLDRYELHCTKCGSLIESGKAFGASIERVRK